MISFGTEISKAAIDKSAFADSSLSDKLMRAVCMKIRNNVLSNLKKKIDTKTLDLTVGIGILLRSTAW